MAFWREVRAMRRMQDSDASRQIFELTGDVEALRNAVTSARQAADLAPPDSPMAPIAASLLSRALRLAFEETRDDDVLRESVALADHAVARISEGDANWSSFHNEVANVRLAAFERFDAPDDLTRSIAAAEVAVAAAKTRADLGGKLANLANIHRVAYDRFGDTRHLDEAIDVGHRAVAALPPDAGPLPIALTVLFVAYQQRFDVVGLVEVLDQAVVLGREAIRVTRADDPARAGRLSNLAVAQTKRFLHTNSSEDLNEAIALATQAVEATPEEHPDLALYMTGLGNALRRRGERTGSVDDLSAAVTAGLQAVEIQPDVPGWQSNLLNSRMALYRRTGDAVVLEAAVKQGERVLGLTPSDHRQLPRWTSNLGIAYLDRFHHTNETADVERAVALGEQAVAALPAWHPERAVATAQLFLAYQVRLEATGQNVDVRELRDLTDWMDTAPPSSPFHRVQLGRAAGRIAVAMGEHELTSRILDAAVCALPTVAPSTLGRNDQEHALSQHAGLVGEAVAAKLAVGDPVRAIELAETGRGVLLTSALDLRTDLARLVDVDPGLAREVQFARDRVTEAEEAAPETMAQRWREYEDVVTQARQRPGFSDFLLPPRFDDLRPLDDGTVVVVNVSPDRGDAIIVRADGDPAPLRLPGLRHDDVLCRALELWNATAAITNGSWAASLRARRVVGEVLRWSWDEIAGPVAAALPTGRPHRLWWLPIGPLGLFPFHAAGPPDGQGMLDLAVSSYTPTLQALARSRDQLPAPVRRQLTVALAETPDLPPLPATTAEALALASHAPGGRVLPDDQATTTEVLDALRESSWAHFACHAVVDPAAPSSGGLYLYDGPLSVGAINRLRLDRAEFAYLSACSTARTGLRHADEAVHLASAFHIAGYRHVIGSLWPLGDVVASQAAKAFYGALPPASSSGDFASVLHDVVCALRDEQPDRPERWAALIHSGPS